jgi:hypothetical protein
LDCRTGADGSASVLVGFVDQVDERAAVGATALAHGAQAVHSQTANHGILERHHVSFRWSKPWALSFVYRLLSETGFRITQSDDKRKGTIPLSAFLAEYRRSLDTIR